MTRKNNELTPLASKIKRLRLIFLALILLSVVLSTLPAGLALFLLLPLVASTWVSYAAGKYVGAKIVNDYQHQAQGNDQTNLRARFEEYDTRLQGTLGDEEWMKANEAAIKRMFPDTWTHTNNLNLLDVRSQLELLGVDSRSTDEFAYIMSTLQRKSMILRDGMNVRRNPHSVYTHC